MRRSHSSHPRTRSSPSASSAAWTSSIRRNESASLNRLPSRTGSTGLKEATSQPRRRKLLRLLRHRLQLHLRHPASPRLRSPSLSQCPLRPLFQIGKPERDISPTVREGSPGSFLEPSLTVGLAPGSTMLYFVRNDPRIHPNRTNEDYFASCIRGSTCFPNHFQIRPFANRLTSQEEAFCCLLWNHKSTEVLL